MRDILEQIRKVNANWHSYADPAAVIRDLQAQLDHAQVEAIEKLQKQVVGYSKAAKVSEPKGENQPEPVEQKLEPKAKGKKGNGKADPA